MPVDLAFRDLTRSARSVVNRAMVLRVITAALPYLRIRRGKTVELAVTVIGTARMRALNKKWRKVDRATDVLAFPLSQPSTRGYTAILLGDVFICPVVVREKAEKYGNTVRKQVAWTLVHGLLHLAGHDHPDASVGTPTLRRRGEEMARLEQKILKKLFR
jgi:probable rRNA maturation factor